MYIQSGRKTKGCGLGLGPVCNQRDKTQDTYPQGWTFDLLPMAGIFHHPTDTILTTTPKPYGEGSCGA